MEQTNRKKGIYIVLTVIISILFLFGIVFTIISQNNYGKADDYNQAQEQIDDYYTQIENL